MCTTFRATKRKYIGAFITSIDDIPVYDEKDAKQELLRLRKNNIDKFHITLAPEPLPSLKQRKKINSEHTIHDIYSMSIEVDDNHINGINIENAYQHFDNDDIHLNMEFYYQSISSDQNIYMTVMMK